MRLKKKLTVILVALVALLLVILPTSAVFAETTNLTQTLAGGALGVTPPASAAFAGKTVSSSEQTDTANIVGINVVDTRGTGAGWNCTMAVTHLNTKAPTKLLAGSNSTVGFTGTYNGLGGVLNPVGTFKVEITTGGAVGVAVFKWWNTAGTLTSAVTTASTVLLSNGITVTFAAATYAVGDSWSAGVDVFPYNYGSTKGLTITPGTITVNSGSITGVTAGSLVLMTGTAATSDAKTVIIATVNNGLGDYSINVGLSQTVHPNSLAGAYTSVATITVS